MDLSLQELSRAKAESLARYQSKRRGWKPQQWCFTWKGQELQVKDVRHCALLYRWTLGRLLLWHEAAIYRKLGDVHFAPRYFGRLDADALMIERLPFLSLHKTSKSKISSETYDRLEECVQELHTRGIVHLDLRAPGNVLLTAEGRPILIDFANAINLGVSWLSRRLLMPLLAAIDRSAILKHRHRNQFHPLSTEQRRRYDQFLGWRRLWVFKRLKRRVAYRTPH